MHHFCIFGLQLEKTFIIFEISTLKLVKSQSFMFQKKKFGKAIVTFEIRTFESFQMEIFMLNKKRLNLGPKLSYLGLISGLEFFHFVRFEISIFEFIKKQSFMLSRKTLSLGQKMR